MGATKMLCMAAELSYSMFVHPLKKIEPDKLRNHFVALTEI
jgi:hypothetical protein